MKLRWMYRKNEGVTASQVAAYRVNHFCSMEGAKRALINQTEPVLQYFDPEVFDSDEGVWGTWLDVPTVCLPHKE